MQEIQLGEFAIISGTKDGGSHQGGKNAVVRSRWILYFLKVKLTDFLINWL